MSGFKKLGARILLAVSACISFGQAHAAAPYQFTVFGALDTSMSTAYSVNEAGVVVGAMSGYNGNQREFFDRAAQWTPTSKFSTNLSLYEGAAYGINNQGEVVGWVNSPGVSNGTGSALWTSGQLTVTPGDYAAMGINDAGQWVAGNAVMTGSVSRTLSSLGGSFANGVAINAGGQVAGGTSKAWRKTSARLVASTVWPGA